MNKEQLIALATKRYHEQMQREYHYRQSIRDGSDQSGISSFCHDPAAFDCFYDVFMEASN